MSQCLWLLCKNHLKIKILQNKEVLLKKKNIDDNWGYAFDVAGGGGCKYEGWRCGGPQRNANFYLNPNPNSKNIGNPEFNSHSRQQTKRPRQWSSLTIKKNTVLTLILRKSMILILIKIRVRFRVKVFLISTLSISIFHLLLH